MATQSWSAIIATDRAPVGPRLRLDGNAAALQPTLRPAGDGRSVTASGSGVRGVPFQPVQAAGRLECFNPATDRLTLTEVRRKILEQTTVFRPEDLLPVPCHPDSLAMGYALKINGCVVPLTGLIDPKVLIEGGRNTIVYEQDDAVRAGVFKLFATNHSPESGAGSLRDLLCCLPRLDAPGDLGYQNIFRVLIMQFIDAHSFDVRSVKKTCVHIVHPDGRLIPFDTYNLFYRDGLEQSRLAPLRVQAELAMGLPTGSS